MEKTTNDGKQYLLIVRHGDRWDYSNPEWKNLKTSRTGDSPLSTLGHRQAREVGKFIDNWMNENSFSAEDVTWLSSPFLRCLQTSEDALNAFENLNVNNLQICPEYSIFEWDGHGGEWHADLPPIEERKHYFPRLDTEYKSLFLPALPEPRGEFFARCERVANCFHKRFPYKPRQIIVMVSHAAGCVAMAKTFASVELADITPAGPCSIYGFAREGETETWTLDPHDKLDGMNGYTGHLSDMGTSTIPWNNFGDGKVKFYTGPPTSRFAPKDCKVAMNSK